MNKRNNFTGVNNRVNARGVDRQWNQIVNMIRK